MLRVVHFEIHADEPERAVKFYEDVFNWSVKKWPGNEEYWLVATGKKEPGIDGAILHRVKEETTVNTIQVPSVDDYLDRIKRAGGRLVMDKTAVPGVGYMAYVADTEKNVLGIMQMDPTAK